MTTCSRPITRCTHTPHNSRHIYEQLCCSSGWIDVSLQAAAQQERPFQPVLVIVGSKIVQAKLSEQAELVRPRFILSMMLVGIDLMQTHVISQ